MYWDLLEYLSLLILYFMNPLDINNICMHIYHPKFNLSISGICSMNQRNPMTLQNLSNNYYLYVCVSSAQNTIRTTLGQIKVFIENNYCVGSWFHLCIHGELFVPNMTQFCSDDKHFINIFVLGHVTSYNKVSLS